MFNIPFDQREKLDSGWKFNASLLDDQEYDKKYVKTFPAFIEK